MESIQAARRTKARVLGWRKSPRAEFYLKLGLSAAQASVWASALIFTSLAYASPTRLEGRIREVTDGDTVTLVDNGQGVHKIRLNGIDAPEASQAFGGASKRHLEALVARKYVVAECVKRDKYKRLVCKLLIDNTDVNLTQVESGFAWHFKKYQSDQLPADRQLYAAAERNARAAKKGLWQEPNPLAPWDFREMKKTRAYSKPL